MRLLKAIAKFFSYGNNHPIKNVNLFC